MKEFRFIKFYKLLLDVAWYSFIIVASSWILTNIYSVVFEGVVKTGDFLKFKVQANALYPNLPKMSNTFDFLISKPAILELKISSISINQLGKPFAIFYLVSLLVTSFLGFYQVKLLRGFLKNILDKQIFVAENVTALKNIAMVEVLAIPLSILYYLIMGWFFRDGQMLNFNFKLVTDFVDCFESIPTTLEYFLFAGVFALGYKLKQENDLTI